MVAIKGNTYPHRSALAAMGGRWSPSDKCWMVPEAVADKAIALVGSEKPRSGYRPRTCKDCGCKINYGVYCGKCEYR